MGLISEFKTFALKGNVLDLAVGVIIGGAFGNIVNSLINDIIMPLVGKVIGDVDFKNLFIPLSEKVTATSLDAARAQGPVVAWGSFLTITINFLILAFVLFLVIKAFNEAKKRFEATPPPAPAVPPAPTKDQVLLTEIRDLLARR
ncbi:MAG: large conductance mechanosensitive channel protein MscL [Phycisphaerales bacterium]|jgi:large conductance mechanosensitive channel|nr:large conductance mechanosensitive channel protein MscL [Phycisphaerales bacterium]